MSDEVKQAAERLRDGRYSSLHDEDEYFMSSRKFEDMGILANAYLDEHDDETAKENATLLTTEILQASGWERKWEGTPYWQFCGTCAPLLAEHHVAGFTLHIGFGHVKTVGDLRKLLDALHIPAVVVVPKGGE